MENIIEAFTLRKRATILFLIVLTICGYFSYTSIPKEDNPNVKIPMIYTVITHQGISPTDSKKLILRPMEMALRSISGIKQLKSYAFEGSGVILIEFHAGFDSDKALRDVRAKINDTEHELPKDTDKPVIKEINLSLFPVLNIILTGNIPQDSLISIARDLRDKVENIQDVLSVDISGDREDIVEVIINPETLNYYGFNLSQIKQMIAENNSLIAVGKVKNEGGSFSVKIPSTVESVN